MNINGYEIEPGAYLGGADLRNLTFQSVDFEKCFVNRCDFWGAIFLNCIYRACKMNSSNLTDSIFVE